MLPYQKIEIIWGSNSDSPALAERRKFLLLSIRVVCYYNFLLILPEGLSETAIEDKEFDQHFWNENEKNMHRFIDEIVAIALSATQIPLSTFTNLFHKRFRKHSMLESTLEILQQFYIYYRLVWAKLKTIARSAILDL